MSNTEKWVLVLLCSMLFSCFGVIVGMLLSSKLIALTLGPLCAVGGSVYIALLQDRVNGHA